MIPANVWNFYLSYSIVKIAAVKCEKAPLLLRTVINLMASVALTAGCKFQLFTSQNLKSHETVHVMRSHEYSL